jgi:hypothetical protein
VLAYSQHRSAFLNGEVKSGGWRWYFPYATLVKTTIPELLLIAAALIVVAARVVQRRDATPGGFRLYDVVPIVLLIGWYWAFAVSSHLNIGYRHMLPAIVAEIILIGALGGMVSRAFRPDTPPAAS